MADFFPISEAVAIGIHACALLAHNPERPLSAREIANRLGTTFDYTVRVLHRLRRNGILKSLRGSTGGFLLTAPPEETTVLSIIENLEGEIKEQYCLFSTPRCETCCRIFGDIRIQMIHQIRDHFSRITLKDLADKESKLFQ